MKDTNLHNAFFLLNKSLYTPKLVFLLRASTAFRVDLQQYVDKCRECFSSLFNLNFQDDNLWKQASLPVKYGGLGLRDFSVLAPSCFLSSMAASALMQKEALKDSIISASTEDFNSAINCWKTHSPNASLPPTNLQASQKEWDKTVCEALQNQLFLNASPFNKARLHSVSSFKSGAWIEAVPSANLGLRLSSKQFTVVCGLRLGASIVNEHKCHGCGEKVDNTGSHLLSCKRSSSKQTRHDGISKIFQKELKLYGFSSVLEPKGIVPGSNYVPDGITLAPFHKGKCLAWDVCVIHPTADSYIDEAAVTPQSAAEIAEKRKQRKYESLMAEHEFAPLILETYGALGNTFKAIITQLHNKCAMENKHYFFQTISVTAQRENANIILSYLNKF